MKIIKKEYKVDDKKIIEISLINKNNIRVSALNLGAIITEIITPDIYGNYENIVLSLKNKEDYFENPSYIGATIGRTSGRIKNAKFKLNGTEYNLSKNYGENSGHGGENGFHKKLMDYETFEENDSLGVIFSFTSPDLEENYPGEVKVKIKYTLNNDNEFKIEYFGLSDKDTLLNITNHSYFNLAGNYAESIKYHNLFINSNEILELDESLAPTGDTINVMGTPFDFNFMKEIGEDMSNNHKQLIKAQGYDHYFILNDNDELDEIKVKLGNKFSGRELEIYSDYKGVLFYSQNFTNKEVLSGGNSLDTHRGIALEFQNPPIGKDEVYKEDSILKKNEEYNKTILYKFKLRSGPSTISWAH